MNSAKCGYFDLNRSPRQTRTILRVQGPDAPRFLQGVLSADIHHIDPNTAAAACLLSAKGKVISEVIVVPEGSFYLLVIPHEIAPQTMETLQRFIIMDDVEVIEEQEQGAVWFSIDPHDMNLPVSQSWRDLHFARTRHPAPGYLTIGSKKYLQNLEKSNLERFDSIHWQRIRIESASPEWGREIVADRFPPECGFAYSVSYNKGCFIGQEPLARIHARGQVNWVLVQVESDYRPPIELVEQHVPIALTSATREQAGNWTSWAYDDNLCNKTIGLAVVHRSLASKNTVLSVVDSPNHDVVVQSNPLGDDPGIRKN